jgi:hypothetical protein
MESAMNQHTRKSSAELEAQFEQAVQDLNKAAPPPRPVREQFPFVSLSEKLADSIVEAYEQLLVELQNKLEQAKLAAQSIREENKARAADLQDFTSRVEDFSKTLLDAHAKFHA